MLQIEVFRPDEMMLELKRMKKNYKLGNMKHLTYSQLNELKDQFPDNPYLNIDQLSENESEDEDEIVEEESHKLTRGEKLKKELKKIFKKQNREGERRKSKAGTRITKKADNQLSKPIVLKRQNSND